MIVPHDNSLNVSGSFSLSVWIKPDSLLGAQTLISKGTSTQPPNYWLMVFDTDIGFGFAGESGPASFVTEPLSIGIGDWHHVVVTYDVMPITDANR